MAYQFITVETESRIATITLNRPDALNALSAALMEEFGDALDRLERDDNVGVIVVTGGTKVFAAGADIRDMEKADVVELFASDMPRGQHGWDRLERCRKPLIAAVAGHALGGGCELAMACDIIIAADNAKFGQPEIRIGTMPGAGGTQRLAHAIGKAKTMELCLTGRSMSAEEAERAGLVALVVPAEQLMEAALKMAGLIASHSLPVTMMIKEAVNQAFEMPLQAGLLHERRLFQATFATEDRREGMAAFIDKRRPAFRHR
jgi:enoyl-CoA hydratase